MPYNCPDFDGALLNFTIGYFSNCGSLVGWGPSVGWGPGQVAALPPPPLGGPDSKETYYPRTGVSCS